MGDGPRLACLCLLGLTFYCRSVQGFLSGFPKERCDDMDPALIKVEKVDVKEEPAEFNSSSSDNFEEPPPTSVQPSTRHNLYRFVTSSPMYRRGRLLDITIRGPEFNALMLQVRKIGSDERRGFDKVDRVGEFTSWPSSLQPVMCDQGKATALTNKNFGVKEDITVKWKAPKDNVGEVHIVGRFISNDEYWQLTESREIPMNEFPVNLAKCGKAKSCILYSESSDSCHEDDCDFILTYSVLNQSFVEFVLGGSARGENNYLAVGFSKTAKIQDMKMIACTKAKTVAEIRYYVVPKLEDGPMEHSEQPLENRKMDLDGDRLWCSFTVPIAGIAEDENTLDLTKPLYQVYMRGSTNNTKTANLPILSPEPIMSKTEVQIQKIKLQYHKMEKPNSLAPPLNMNVLFSMILLLLTFF